MPYVSLFLHSTPDADELEEPLPHGRERKAPHRPHLAAVEMQRLKRKALHHVRPALSSAGRHLPGSMLEVAQSGVWDGDAVHLTAVGPMGHCNAGATALKMPMAGSSSGLPPPPLPLSPSQMGQWHVPWRRLAQ